MEPLNYSSPATPGASMRRRWAPPLMLLGCVLLPVTLTLAVRSLILDHRGNAIYRQREREENSIRGFLTGDYKGFLARETSRKGWTRGEWAIGISALAAITCALACADRRWRSLAAWIAAIHFIVGAMLLSYWLITGIPRPWVD